MNEMGEQVVSQTSNDSLTGRPKQPWLEHCANGAVGKNTRIELEIHRSKSDQESDVHTHTHTDMYPTTTMSMISSIVLWSALKALDFCSGVPKSPETISTIFPPYFGCKTQIAEQQELESWHKKSSWTGIWMAKVEHITTNTLDVDEINTATVPRIKLTASGFAWR